MLRRCWVNLAPTASGDADRRRADSDGRVPRRSERDWIYARRTRHAAALTPAWVNSTCKIRPAENVLSTFQDKIVALSSLSTSLTFLAAPGGRAAGRPPLALEMEQGTFRPGLDPEHYPIVLAAGAAARPGHYCRGTVRAGHGSAPDLVALAGGPAPGTIRANSFDLEGTVLPATRSSRWLLD